MKKGRIITVSGISGAGKSHFIKDALTGGFNLEKLTAVTTRKQRENEIDGIDKFFMEQDQFNYLNENNELEGVLDKFGCMYAFRKSDIAKTGDGKNLITEAYFSEVPTFKQLFPDTHCVYIMPENPNAALEELNKRNIPASEKLKRHKDMIFELEKMSESDRKNFFKIFHNAYDEQSLVRFREYLSEITR